MIQCVLLDAKTNEEIDISLPALTCKPSAGEVIHYWEDNLGVSGAKGVRADFRVERVVHDIHRMMVSSGPHAATHVLEIYVTRI